MIVAGGDGSVSAAVQRFAGTGIPLGVLPFGTYNLLAQDLGMSTDLEEAVRQLAAAEERRIDLGQVGRRRFHTLGGLGYFSRVARQRAEVRKSISNKLVGAALAALRSLSRGGNLDVTIDDGARRESFRTPAVLITNNLMAPDTWRRRRLDAGLFEINIVRGDVPFPLLRGGLAAFMGSVAREHRHRHLDGAGLHPVVSAPAGLPVARRRGHPAAHAASFRDHTAGADGARPGARAGGGAGAARRRAGVSPRVKERSRRASR